MYSNLLSPCVLLGRTALHWAVLGGRLASVKALLKHSTAAGALSSHDEQGFTPLLCAALAGAPEIAAALLKVSIICISTNI